MKKRHLAIMGAVALIFLVIISLVFLNSNEQPKYPYNLKPVGIAYHDDGALFIEYKNVYDRVLKVTSVELSDTINGEKCIGVSAQERPVSEVFLRTGEGFTLSANCLKKYAGDPFDFFIELNYTENSGFHKAYHTEQGHIRGYVVSTKEPLYECSNGCYQMPAVL